RGARRHRGKPPRRLLPRLRASSLLGSMAHWSGKSVTNGTSTQWAGLGEGGWGAFGHLAGDDHALDLAGALPDPLDAKLAEKALGDVLAHVAAAAEHLDGAVGDAARHLRAVELGHRALRVRHLHVRAGP